MSQLSLLLDQLSGFLYWAVGTIPTVVWAALLALGGVVLSNRENTKRLIRQLQHEAAENAKNRISEVRRQVYAQFAHELTRANGFLASIPTLDPGKSNLARGLAALAGEAAKVQLIAEPKTSLLVGAPAATQTPPPVAT
jgi:hypothetical protein